MSHKKAKLARKFYQEYFVIDAGTPTPDIVEHHRTRKFIDETTGRVSSINVVSQQIKYSPFSRKACLKATARQASTKLLKSYLEGNGDAWFNLS